MNFGRGERAAPSRESWAIRRAITGTVELAVVTMLLVSAFLAESRWHNNGPLIVIAAATAIGTVALSWQFVTRRAEAIIIGAGDGSVQHPTVDWLSLPNETSDVFAMLSWRTRLAPLVGRDVERNDLLKWATCKDRRLRVRFLTGPAGVGKRRLSAEVASEINARFRAGSAGFLSTNTPVRVKLPALLIISYPEERLAFTIKLLGELESRIGLKGPVSVLLLSRQSLSYFYDHLAAAGLQHLIDDEPMVLEPLREEDAATLFRETVNRIGSSLKIPGEEVSDHDLASWLDTDPGLHQRPLFVIAAAVSTTLRFGQKLGAWARTTVDGLVQLELERYRRASNALGLDHEAAARLAALAAVSGGLDSSDLRRIANPKLEVGLPPPDQVVDAIANLPWWTNGRWLPPVPDIIAAAIVFETLKLRPEMAPEWIWAAIATEASASGARLARLAVDIETLYGNDGAAFVQWLYAMIDGENQSGRAAALELIASDDELPAVLAPLAVRILNSLLVVEKSPQARASMLGKLSRRLGEVGDQAAALTAVQDAVEIYRRLVADDRESFEPALAASLNDLSSHLSEIGDWVGALRVAQEATAITRRLAAAEPLRFEPDLARSLNNLSNRLNEVGDRAGALRAIQEGMAIISRLALTQPMRFESELAMSLNNLSNRLSDVGDQIEALHTIEDATTIMRHLAATDPVRFTADLAATLNNLSARLSAMGNQTEALHASAEAVNLYRRLAKEQPAVFELHLATGLNTFSNRLRDVGDHLAALKATEEALEIHRRRAQSQPAAFGPELVSSLNNLSVQLSDNGERAGALRAIVQAVELSRRLAEAQPVRFAPDLARSLNNLAIQLSDAGDWASALQAIDEAVTLGRHLAESHPVRFEPDLARSLQVRESLRRGESG